MSEITIRELGEGSGLWAIDYTKKSKISCVLEIYNFYDINGCWMTAYGLTKDEAEYFRKNFDYDEIGRKWGWAE